MKISITQGVKNHPGLTVMWMFAVITTIIASITIVVDSPGETILVPTDPVTNQPISTLPLPTIVCGTFTNPEVIMGTPTGIEESSNGVTYIRFEDNFLLALVHNPNLFLGKRGLIQLSPESNVITSYGIPSDVNFHPCPPGP